MIAMTRTSIFVFLMSEFMEIDSADRIGLLVTAEDMDVKSLANFVKSRYCFMLSLNFL